MSALDPESEEQLRGAVERLRDNVSLDDLEAPVEPAPVSEPEVPSAVPETVDAVGLEPGALIAPAEAPTEAEAKTPEVPQPVTFEGQLGERLKEKAPPQRKRKRIREDIKPMDSAEILEELKGRFLSSAMKDLIGPGRRPLRPRTSRPRRSLRGPTRKSLKPTAIPAQLDRELEILLPVTVKDLSKELGVKASLLLKKLIETGDMLKMNDVLSEDLVELLALEFNRKVTIKKPKDVEDIVQEAVQADGNEENLQTRAPVVAFLGHVDHGKTSLLDRIRESNVAAGEAGGITQHMAAYRVTTGDRKVVFLDTPGHEAFTDMRSRGAQVTDIVVLVVAADDGVMPQTEEAVNHARAAGVPIVVALNKIDKPDANGMRAKQQLSALGLTPEEWGGDTVVVETSAIQGKGISELLEMLTLVADLQDLKADPTMPARGTVLEAQVHEGRGVIATGLIRAGTLRIGDSILVGQTSGRVKALYDDTGRPLNEAGPSMPVLISGLSGMPSAGARLIVMEGDTSARQIAEERALRGRVTTVREHVTLENLFSRLEEGEIAELPLILKADGQGSLLALQEQLENLSTPEVRVRILHAAVGGINESDVLLAHASDAITVGFHVVPSDKARILAREKAVDIRLFNVIYKVLDDIRSALEGTLEPEEVEEVKGHLEVRQVFRISRTGNIAGCYVKDGIIERADILRLIRDDMVIYEGGRIDSLRRHKDDVREVKEGFECGVKIQGYEDVKVGDIIEAYVINLVPRKLSTVDNG
jgi:translation initiation factor IF-2